MKLPDQPSSVGPPRAAHGPDVDRLSDRDVEELMARLSDDSAIEFEEATAPFEEDGRGVDDEDLEELLD
ncbi:hypothetical protein [Haloarcula argentinensis]|uniref:Uncharacterized protein n=1 Tax=Haloarcula argentinensis TaxID=43776 RepID=A0A847UN56_HALAR|nr:hypothetical protein [Haloarcula argentinensis]NLV13946.1 hypothetical protein [Haloarcula argentinensis]